MYVCGSWSTSTGPFLAATSPNTRAYGCGSFGDLELSTVPPPAVPNGQGASWSATAPSGLSITHIYTVGDGSNGVGSGEGWWGEFFWNGGPGAAGRSNQIRDNAFPTDGCCRASFNNQTVGWFISCARHRGAVSLRISPSVGLTSPSTRCKDPGSTLRPGCGRRPVGSAWLPARVLRRLAVGRV